MRRLFALGLLFAAGLSVAVFSSGSAGASAPAPSVSSAQTAFWQGVKALLPANAGARPDVSVSSVSCASAGNCSAVGRYRNMSGNFQGLLLSETSGTWQRGVQAILPANAGSKPFAWFDSVSCSSPGNCAAVGFYNNSGNSHGLLVTETSGTWQPGVEAVLPANGSHTAGDVTINSVSCASAGNCTAVGSYFDNATNGHGMLLTETSGTWQQGIEPPLPANADALALTSVSCVSAGNCTVVGAYDDSSHHIQGLLLTESSGTWQTGVEAVLPANASSSAAFPQLQSVSCVSVGNCTAVGYYFNSAGRQGLLLTETSGTWQPGIEAILPANARSNPWVGLPSVSCVSAGNCTAVGGYDDSSHHHQGLLLRQTSGTWQTGVAAPLPVNAGSNPNVHLDSLSCASAGNCAAVGGYHDSSNTVQGLLLSETSGTWQRGVEAPLPANAGPNPYGAVSSVSCGSAGNCTAVGHYYNRSDNEEGLLLSQPASIVCIVPNVKGETLAAAKRSIRGSHCSVGKVTYAYSGAVRAGHVISQKPRAARHLQQATPVNLVVSAG